jgi:hypothetical protein
MIKRLLTGLLLILVSLIPLTPVQTGNPVPRGGSPSLGTLPDPQEYPAKKPKSDYMSSFFSRNTKALGLKEDLALKKLMKQPSIKWAVRTGIRHVLD